MGIFGVDSTSNATDNRQSAGDNSNLLHGRGVVTEAGGKTLQGRGKDFSGGGSDLTGANINTGLKNSGKINTGLQVKGKKAVVNIDNGGDAAQSVAASLAQAVAAATSGSTGTTVINVSSPENGGSQPVSIQSPPPPPSVPDTTIPVSGPETEDTETGSARHNGKLWYAVGALALLLVFMVIKRKWKK